MLLPLEGDLVCLPLECGLVLLSHQLHPPHVLLVACLHLPHHGKHELLVRVRRVRLRLRLRRRLRHEAVDAADLVEVVVGVHVGGGDPGPDVPVPPDLGGDDGGGLKVGWALL